MVFGACVCVLESNAEHTCGRAGQAWVSEYGDPANVTDFPYLLAASPLDNVSVPNGTGQYPAVMVSTGAHPWAHANEPVELCSMLHSDACLPASLTDAPCRLPSGLHAS